MTNAQFPDQMETLRPCTQLYISIDAPTEASLKVISAIHLGEFDPSLLS